MSTFDPEVLQSAGYRRVKPLLPPDKICLAKTLLEYRATPH